MEDEERVSLARSGAGEQTGKHGLAPGYNAQLTAGCTHKLIVGVETSKQPSGSFHLLPALDRIKERLGVFPQQGVADGDYTKREAVIGAAGCGVEYYGSWTDTIAVDRSR